MEKTIIIKSVEVTKRGTNEKTGKDWSLYRIQCSGDDDMGEFTTFNPQYANSQGQQMKSNFEYNEKFKNWQEISAQKESENSKHEEIMNGLRKVFELIDERLPEKPIETGFENAHDNPTDKL